MVATPILAGSDSLVGRTAAALYAVASRGDTTQPPYRALGMTEQRKWQEMATTALAIAYREPVAL